MAVVSTEPAYKLTVPAWGRLSADEMDLHGEALGNRGGFAAPASLHAHFQHLAMLAASFAKQDPAAIMLTTITLERPLGRVSFYERPGVVGQLTGAQVGAALAPWGEPINQSLTPEPMLSGALGIAGLLQTLDYFASIKISFDTLYRLVDNQASQSASGEPGPSSGLTADGQALRAQLRRLPRMANQPE